MLYQKKLCNRYAVLEQAYVMLWRWTHIPSYQNRYHEGIDRNDSGHDHRDQRLYDRLLAFHSRPRFALSHTFIIRSGRNVPTPAIPMPDFAVPYAAPAPVYVRVRLCWW
jgi:hypothetical protein